MSPDPIRIMLAIPRRPRPLPTVPKVEYPEGSPRPRSEG